MLSGSADKPKNALTAACGGVTIYLPLKGLIDIDKEMARLKKELDNLNGEIKRAEAKLNNQGFVSKAPAAVVEKERAKKADAETKKAALEERMAQLKELA